MVADDVTLISHDPMELQIMLNVQAEHANSKRYLVSQQKSSIVVMNGSQNYECTFNNENLHVSESVTHLGIQRCSNITATSKESIENRMVFRFVQKMFSDNTIVRIFFFFVALSANFFLLNLTLGCWKSP